MTTPPQAPQDDSNENEETYKYTYHRFFNVVFHVGVIFNVLLVIWLYLVFFDVI